MIMDFSSDKKLFNIPPLPDVIRAEAIAEGEQYLGFDFGALSAVMYTEFSRTGNRTHYEDVNFARRTAVNSLFFAEYCEQKGRFTADLLNGIWAICEESAWCIPAHNNGQPLPDVQDPIVDLFAAQTASQLGIISYFADEVFGEYADAVKKRVQGEVMRRVLAPFLEKEFWWMGYGNNRRDRPSNWTAWCASTCLCACLTTVTEPMYINRFADKIKEIIGYYIENYPDDGGCDEGADYWYMSAGCMFDCLEFLYRASDGKYNMFDNPKIRAMGAYIYNAHMCGDYFVNFADCGAKANRGGARTYLFGKRTGDRRLTAFGAEDFKNKTPRLMPNQMNLLHKIFAAENAAEIFAYDEKFTPTETIYMESLQLFKYCRGGLSFCIKGGTNGDNHNHNDVGSFMLYADGKPFIIDIGVESYSKKTFSAERYTIWTMQSAYHNLPTVNGCMQHDGAEYRASDVRVFENSISFDIQNAYPEAAGIEKWTRSAVCSENEITVTDEFRLRAPENDVYFSLMLADEPRIGNNSFSVNGLNVKFNTDVNIKCEKIDIPYDAKLTPIWGERVYRIIYTADTNKISLTFRKE